jgi:hypothetical protein
MRQHARAKAQHQNELLIAAPPGRGSEIGKSIGSTIMSTPGYPSPDRVRDGLVKHQPSMWSNALRHGRTAPGGSMKQPRALAMTT